MSETKKCAQCGHEKPIEDFSKSYKNLCKACVAENERFKRQLRTECANSANVLVDSDASPLLIINVRLRIATACMQGLLAGGYKAAYKDLAITAVACADALINELNKKKDENNQ